MRQLTAYIVSRIVEKSVAEATHPLSFYHNYSSVMDSHYPYRRKYAKTATHDTRGRAYVVSKYDFGKCNTCKELKAILKAGPHPGDCRHCFELKEDNEWRLQTLYEAAGVKNRPDWADTEFNYERYGRKFKKRKPRPRLTDQPGEYELRVMKSREMQELWDASVE